MNIDQRLNILEARSDTKQAFTPDQLAYINTMIAGSGCNKTIEQLDAGRNMSAVGIILTAYGLDPDDNTGVTDVPTL